MPTTKPCKYYINIYTRMQVKEKLSTISVSDDTKSKLLAEIAAEHGLRLQVLALEYTPQFHKQVNLCIIIHLNVVGVAGIYSLLLVCR